MKPSVLFVVSVLFFFILFFGFSKLSPEIRNPEKSGPVEIENVDLNAELNLVRDSLSDNDKDYLGLMDKQFASASTDSAKQMALQQISSYWYRMGYVNIAAEYALKIAQVFPTGETWSIAASNFVLAARQMKLSEQKKSELIVKAKRAFISASDVDSLNVNHKLNYALLCTDFPSADQPMEGILLLRQLNEQHPENVNVMYHLARLAIQTNQWERARERLERILTLEPENQRAICLMVSVAQHEGDKKKVTYWSAKCKMEN